MVASGVGPSVRMTAGILGIPGPRTTTRAVPSTKAVPGLAAFSTALIAVIREG